MESAASLVIQHNQCKASQPELYIDRLADGGVVAFAGPNPSALRTGHAPAIAVLGRLEGIYPRSLPFDELAAGAGLPGVGGGVR